MVTKRAICVWISVFATFLAIMCSFAMAVLLINEGTGAIVRPYILGTLGDLSVEIYLWISVAATFILLGITCIIIYRKQPLDPELVKMFLKVGGNLAALREAQEASITETADQLEYNRKVNQKFFGNIKSDIEEATKEMLALLANQRKSVKDSPDLTSTIEKTGETGEKPSADLKKQETAIIEVKSSNEENTKSLKK